MTTILLLTMTATTAAQDNITDNTVNPELEKQYTTTSQINEYENSRNNSDNKIIKKEQTRREISLILPEGRKAY
ncbi:MAG: hypothetical protein SOZ23_07240 [Methanosphaera sp.]|uniref:hypothetical protein n=1 Tax=Methanosphaera sp. TaxID=2666342 RepID=UPI0025F18A0F|nr:hypothetical protein [Methanosphaera sp.]MCI5867058.1 hypothetical protein [Methanosphaera sp.]MDD6535235.1 hypothetical protein [Methanosphaera sp.]MDY3956555.1 hypothetical protein [Methanosphaera sp.]